MQSFKITIAYDGTRFVGWQRQASGVSIQGLIEDALAALDEREVVVTGAGRTDAGVHALGQVASFALNRAIDADALVRAVNARLPPEVRVVAAEPVDPTFHARFGATRKTYRYRIWNAPVLSPFERDHAWHLSGPLDIEAMKAAAAHVEGRRDFSAFQAAGAATKSPVREVYVSRVLRPSDDPAIVPHPGGGGGVAAAAPVIVYEVVGSGFLRHMVRNIVGSLVEIGRGRYPVEWLAHVIDGRNRELAGPTAPPQGLVLVSVEYEGAASLPRLAADR